MIGPMRSCPAALALFAASLAFGQSEVPQALVRLSVSVTNAKGEPVTDLEPADLHVREDGKPRQIVFFRFAGKKDQGEPAAGEFSNRRRSAPTVILFDRWNERMLTATSAWQGIRDALPHMNSVDRFFIYFLTNHGDLFPVHPLPSTDADLRAAPNPSASELRAKLDDAVQKLRGFRDFDAQDPGIRATTTFQALTALGTQMASLAGRKNLIWVTHGIPLETLLMSPDDWLNITPQVRTLSAAAAQSQIAIYTVDESEAGAGADLTGESRFTLQMFSGLTGGRWYPSDSAEAALNDSIADSHGEYRIAYYSPIRQKDTKEHKIRVDSARKGLRILARQGYFGPASTPDPDAMEDAVFNAERRSPIEASEIGLRVKVSRDPAANKMHLTIRVDPEDVFLEHTGGIYQGRLGVMLAFYNNGFLKAVLPPVHVSLHFTPEQFSVASKTGIVISEDAPMDNTTQKIRVMVFDDRFFGLGSVTFAAQ